MIPADRGPARGPVDSLAVPRFAGPATFARLPRADEVSDVDVAIVGVPFDSGVSYRPGARFGPAHIRQSSKLLRPYNPAQDVEPFASQQVVDAGDIACNPFDIEEAMGTIQAGALSLLERARLLVTLGGDHTIALGMLRAVSQRHGPVAVIHFDAHLDTWDTYFGAPYTHGTQFRRASEEGLIDRSASVHVGIRGPLYASLDLTEDRELGFEIIPSTAFDVLGVAGVAEQIAARTAGRPGLPVHRHRRARPGVRAGDRAPRKRAGSAPASCSRCCARCGRSTWSASTWSRCPRPTTTPR